MNILKIATITLLIISFASCKRDYADSAAKAPTNISASEGFTCGTLGKSLPGADFGIFPKFSFSTTFTETVTWKIELIGQTSAATKTLSATSSVINSSNSSWIGNHDGLYFFEEGETVTANLIISGKLGICSSTSFTIVSMRDMKTTTSMFMLLNEFSDYESGAWAYPGQFNIGNTTVNVLQSDQIRSPEGKYYMHMEGVSAAANGFFVGGLQSRKSSSNTNTYMLPVKWTDPSKIYLNIYVRGIDNLPAGYFPYAVLNFECQEDDNNNTSSPLNCVSPGVTDQFCPTSEDTWVFKIPVRHTGWQLFSCKYSDLLPSEDFANGGFGNRKLEPQKVCRMQLGMVSSPPFNKISIDIDYACLTYGAPFDPKK